MTATIWCMSEPMCCGDPMVHNSWTGQYECATAYFTLIDEALDSCVPLERLTPDDVGPELVGTLAHWRDSRMSDRFIHIQEAPQ